MRVGIIGASGYTGGELLRLLLFHPQAEVTVAVSREYAGQYVYRTHPNLRKVTALKFSQLNLSKISDNCDVIFMATPHGVSAKYVPKFLEVGIKVIDLSADFRLKNPEDYEKWYGRSHPFPELLKKAVYGLPELYREQIKTAELVACPGCIATSAILALAPLIKEDVIEEDKIIIDSKIGSSGAGGKPSLASHFTERFGVVRPYKPVGHRHIAEIEQELNNISSSKEIRVSLASHAVNIVRGILSTSYAFMKRELKIPQLWKIYRDFYSNEPFIRLVREVKGIYRYPDPKIVLGSNFCDIGFELDERLSRVVIMSAIDNLIKGAAGQAVQNFNIMLGIDEQTGLENPGYHPSL